MPQHRDMYDGHLLPISVNNTVSEPINVSGGRFEWMPFRETHDSTWRLEVTRSIVPNALTYSWS